MEVLITRAKNMLCQGLSENDTEPWDPTQVTPSGPGAYGVASWVDSSLMHYAYSHSVLKIR
jgi:hypothetical protein